MNNMKDYKVPVQSLIDHIKTACDVDPWAKEMAEELLKEHQQIVRCKDCQHGTSFKKADGSSVYICDKARGIQNGDWFCADGEHR